jgi:DNA-binding NtrC family response regulator
VHHFLREFGQRTNRRIKPIPDETMDGLKKYPWPGNIRELQNLIERAVLLSPGSVLRVPLQCVYTRTVPRQDREKIQTLAGRGRLFRGR